jgi:glucokinase
VLRDADSLPNLMDFNLARFIEAEFHAPLFLENDANCFALGEALAGAGKGHDVVVGVTLGTGFGCGIVVNGRIFTGVTGNAGEVAYLPVAGGNFDQMLSGAGVARFYQRVTGRQPPSPTEIGDLAERGDPQARIAWDYYGEAVGTGLGIVAAIIDPNICVLGGSVSQRFPLFREALERKLRALLAPEPAAKLIVARARLDAAAGVTGAAEYAFQRLADQEVAAGA